MNRKTTRFALARRGGGAAARAKKPSRVKRSISARPPKPTPAFHSRSRRESMAASFVGQAGMLVLRSIRVHELVEVEQHAAHLRPRGLVAQAVPAVPREALTEYDSLVLTRRAAQHQPI